MSADSVVFTARSRKGDNLVWSVCNPCKSVIGFAYNTRVGRFVIRWETRLHNLRHRKGRHVS